VTRSPGTAEDDASFGSVVWSNVENVKVDDTSDATAATGFANSHYLKVTNFGFGIPAGSNIDGVIASIIRHGTVSYDCKDVVVSLVVGGSVTGDNKGDTVNTWPVNPGQKDYGGATEKWGCTLTDSVINASNFGIVLAATGTVSWNVCSVQYMCLTVYYTPPAGVKFCGVVCSKFDGVAVSKFDGVA
jgi:hypothetical protein